MVIGVRNLQPQFPLVLAENFGHQLFFLQGQLQFHGGLRTQAAIEPLLPPF
jgi:hypothetical protein